MEPDWFNLNNGTVSELERKNNWAPVFRMRCKYLSRNIGMWGIFVSVAGPLRGFCYSRVFITYGCWMLSRWRCDGPLGAVTHLFSDKYCYLHGTCSYRAVRLFIFISQSSKNWVHIDTVVAMYPVYFYWLLMAHNVTYC